MSSARALALGAAGLGLLYAGSNCIFNVESGHRGIVFNRIGGIKDAVRPKFLYTAVVTMAHSCRQAFTAHLDVSVVLTTHEFGFAIIQRDLTKHVTGVVPYPFPLI